MSWLGLYSGVNRHKSWGLLRFKYLSSKKRGFYKPVELSSVRFSSAQQEQLDSEQVPTAIKPSPGGSGAQVPFLPHSVTQGLPWQWIKQLPPSPKLSCWQGPREIWCSDGRIVEHSPPRTWTGCFHKHIKISKNIKRVMFENEGVNTTLILLFRRRPFIIITWLHSVLNTTCFFTGAISSTLIFFKIFEIELDLHWST